MEGYLEEWFGGVQAKNDSEEALRPKRGFRFTANLEKRGEAMKRTNHEKLRVAVLVSKAALQLIHAINRIQRDSAASFDLQEQFGGVQAKNSSEAGENCRPSFDLRSVPSSRPLIPCSQWEKGECIGYGSFGQVYRGFNREHGQSCAIKEVLVILNDPRSKEQLRQLNQEIYLLEQLSHPNVVQYYGSNTTDYVLSIYMEYVSEGSIHALLAKFGPFKESMIRSYTARILSGLAFLHERRHIHRDIKGANILVGPNNEVKLADFGLAKHCTLPTEELFIGWLLSGTGYNLSADIWSLGCTVIEMATGKPPLHGYEPLCLQRDPASRPSAAQLMDHPFIQNQGS